MSSPHHVGDVFSRSWGLCIIHYLISGQEEIILVGLDMVHGVPQGLLSLTDGIDEPLGRIDLLLDEHDGLFLFLVSCRRPYSPASHETLLTRNSGAFLELSFSSSSPLLLTMVKSG